MKQLIVWSLCILGVIVIVFFTGIFGFFPGLNLINVNTLWHEHTWAVVVSIILVCAVVFLFWKERNRKEYKIPIRAGWTVLILVASFLLYFPVAYLIEGANEFKESNKLATKLAPEDSVSQKKPLLDEIDPSEKAYQQQLKEQKVPGSDSVPTAFSESQFKQDEDWSVRIDSALSALAEAKDDLQDTKKTDSINKAKKAKICANKNTYDSILLVLAEIKRHIARFTTQSTACDCPTPSKNQWSRSTALKRRFSNSKNDGVFRRKDGVRMVVQIEPQ